MTKELANEVEAYLTKKLTPEHGYILIVGENDGIIISNYDGNTITKILGAFAHMVYGKPEDN